MTAALALALLLLAPACGRRWAFAGNTNLPGETGRTGPTNIQGVPPVDLTLRDGANPVDVSVDGSLLQTGQVEINPDTLANGGRLPLPMVDDTAVATADRGEASVDPHLVGPPKPAAPLEEDLGGQPVVGQRHLQTKKDDGSGELDATTSGDPAALTTDGNPTTVLGTVQHVVDQVAHAAEDAVGVVLRHTYEAATPLRDGEDVLAVAPGAVRDGSLRAAPQLQGDPFAPDALRIEFPWMSDLMLARGREGLADVMGPEAAAAVAAEIGARHHADDVQRNLLQRFPEIAKENPSASEPADPGTADEQRARRIHRPYAQYKALRKQFLSDPDDERARNEFWNEPRVQALARQMSEDGVYSSPLEYRRFLLGIGIQAHLTKARLGLLMDRFARAYFGDNPKYYTDDGSGRLDWRKIAVEDKDASNFFTKYIEEALDVLLLTAPAREASTTEGLERHVIAVLEKTARLLAPVTKKDGVVRRYIKTVGEDGRRSFFFELLQFVAFPGYRLEFSVGLGGSEKAPSIRLLAYPLAVLEYLRVFRANGVRLPSFRIFDAQAVSADINQLHLVKAEANARTALGYLRSFINRFYPDVAPAVTYEMLSLDALREGPFNEALALLNNLDELGRKLKDEGGLKKLGDWDSTLEELGQRLARTPEDPLVELGRRLNKKEGPTGAAGKGQKKSGWERLQAWPELEARGLLAGLQELGFLNDLKRWDPALVDGIGIPQLRDLINERGRQNGWARLEQWPGLATRGISAGLRELGMLEGLQHWDPAFVEGLNVTELRHLTRERGLFDGLQRLGLLEGMSADWNPVVAQGMDLAEMKRLLKYIDMMRDRGNRHGDGSGSLRALEYVAFHIMTNGFKNVAAFRLPNAPHAVVKIGGSGEDGFNEFQRWLVERMRSVMGPGYYLPNTAFSARAGRSRSEPVAPALPRPIFVGLEKVGGDPPPYYPMDGEVTTQHGTTWRGLNPDAPATALVAHYNPALGGSTHLESGLPDIEMLIELLSGERMPTMTGTLELLRASMPMVREGHVKAKYKEELRKYLSALNHNPRIRDLILFARQPVTPWEGPH